MKRDWLIKYRKKKELTQEQVASLAYIDRGYYSHIETGKRNPSIHIAINIANVLEFRPDLFFEGEFPVHPSLKDKVLDIFKKVDKGAILYPYDEFDSQLQNLLLFITTGAEKENYCYIIGDSQYMEWVSRELSFIFESELAHYIVLMNIEDYVSKELESGIIEEEFLPFIKSPARIWLMSSEGELTQVAKSILNEKQRCSPLLFIYTLNANFISASFHIQLMKEYNYLMTDYEVVDSPFYQDDRGSGNMLPSFYKQSETIKNRI